MAARSSPRCGGALALLLGWLAAGCQAPAAAAPWAPTADGALPEVLRTGDACLDELRRLAIAAPIEELLAKWNPWWGEFDFHYVWDPILWQGLDRYAAWAVANPDRIERQLLVGLIAACRHDRRPPQQNLRRWREQLLAIRRAMPQ